jgi:hypothetical protein
MFYKYKLTFWPTLNWCGDILPTDNILPTMTTYRQAGLSVSSVGKLLVGKLSLLSSIGKMSGLVSCRSVRCHRTIKW